MRAVTNIHYRSALTGATIGHLADNTTPSKHRHTSPNYGRRGTKLHIHHEHATVLQELQNSKLKKTEVIKGMEPSILPQPNQVLNCLKQLKQAWGTSLGEWGTRTVFIM